MNDYTREMVANGAIPTIEKLIEHYNMGDETLYGTILETGLISITKDNRSKAGKWWNERRCNT